MNIEEIRSYALSLPCTTEDLFDENWITFRIKGKWFLLIQLNAPEPRVAVKLPPEKGAELREHYYPWITAAFHMNKTHWNDLYILKLPENIIREQILLSYQLIINHLPKSVQKEIK